MNYNFLSLALFKRFCRSEIDYLEQAVGREREKYQLSTQAMSSGLSAIPVMAINDSVTTFMSSSIRGHSFLSFLITDLTIC
jgi:hypothetical protein